jgi:hypothetical protein
MSSTAWSWTATKSAFFGMRRAIATFCQVAALASVWTDTPAWPIWARAWLNAKCRAGEPL